MAGFAAAVVLLLADVGPLVHLGSLTDGLRSPARIAVAADGSVYVTEPLLDAVVRFDAAGNYLGTWAVAGGPLGIGLHPDGRVFISLRDEGQVGIYTVSGGGLTRTGTLDGNGNPVVAFVRPTDIAIDAASGRIYVVDAEGDCVYGFAADGSLVLKFGTRGEGSGQFLYPSAIAIDPAYNRLIVADHDGFRAQAFDTSGLFQRRFGFRMIYLPGGSQEGWMPRTQGVAVDAEGRMYYSDALMSAVRIVAPDGTDLGKVVTYGSTPGSLRTPCDLALSPDGTRLYVVSTNTSSVEIYETPTWFGKNEGDGGFDPPGTNWSRYDLLRRLPVLGGWGHNNTRGPKSGYDGPHMIDATIVCGRCHGITGQPGEHPGTLEGQTMLCMSCHSAGGQALTMPIHERDAADPYGTNPNAADGRGSSHAWGVPAVNAQADSVGPAPGSAMAAYLDPNGNMKCATCHEQHNSDAGAPYLRVSNVGDAMCKECHAPRNEGPGQRGTHPVGFDYPGGTGEFPPDANVAPLVIKDGMVECMTCHAPHYATSGGANGGEGDGMLLRAANDDAFCQTCHTGHTGHTPAGSWQPGCRDCHDVHDPNSNNLSLVSRLVHNQTLGIDLPVVFTARSGSNSFDDGDPAANDGICQVCHTSTTYHRYDGSGVPHNDGTTCTDCHPHDNGFMPTGGASCIACHSQPQGTRPAIVNADGSGGHHLGSGVLTDDDCVVCHDMSQHQQGTVRLWDDPNNHVSSFAVTGDPAQLVPFCDACHVNMTHPTTHTVGAPWEPACTECHELHDPANGNLSLVRDVVHNNTLGQDLPVVFTARSGPNSFDDGDPAANDGICQVCHTSTTYHRYDGSGTPHNDGTDCTTCHPHTSGFAPTAGSCLDCHNSPQDNGDGIPPGGRRAVVDEFGWASHHLQGASLDDADCVVCHDMSQHQQGYVRLKNVDDPNNAGAVTVLTGDPASDQAVAAALEGFCLACHDADGAGGSAPFTDGIMPAAIDAVAWADAAHKLGGPLTPMTCFGDGETFGCHATGHGSAKRKLLAPPDASQPPVAGDPLREEEGMCYTCHDSDGPAGTDIESLFALSSHHNVSALDQGDGSKVECVNCHDPHAANSTTPLADPDSGSPWTGSGVDFCLTCHDGAPPAGVSFPASSPGTGYDKSAFVGTAHADGIGARACEHCHDPHGSAYQAMLPDRYVTADYNAYSFGDGDYAACWLCHDEYAIIYQDNHFKNRHKKHVEGEDAPCLVCHDVHGPTDAGEAGLIEFSYPYQAGYDLQFIDGYDASAAFWIDPGQNRGYCYLRCHGENHRPEDYDRRSSPGVGCTPCHNP